MGAARGDRRCRFPARAIALGKKKNASYVSNLNGDSIATCMLGAADSIVSFNQPPAGGWNLVSPRGMAILGNKLYVANGFGDTITVRREKRKERGDEERRGGGGERESRRRRWRKRERRGEEEEVFLPRHLPLER